MKLLVFGATGATGGCLVEQALAQGHEVTAFVRNPTALDGGRERLSIVQGDVLDATAVEWAVAKHDAVLSALGTRGKAPRNTITRGLQNIADAMERHGVRRVILLSALGTAESKAQAGLIFGKIVLSLFLKAEYEERARGERMIQRATLDWTIVRPPRLINEPLRGTCRVLEDTAGVSAKIGRADVAAFMLKQLTDDRYVRKFPGILY